MISHLNVLGAFLVFFVPACQQRQATYDPQSRKRISICGHFISCSRNGSYTLTSIFSSLLRTFFYLISLIPRREGTRSTPRIHKEQGELNFAFMRFMPSLCSLCLPAGKGRFLNFEWRRVTRRRGRTTKFTKAEWDLLIPHNGGNCSMQFDRKQLSNDELILFYQKLLWPRMIEEKMLVLLRQGRISKWFSGIGQEAIHLFAWPM